MAAPLDRMNRMSLAYREYSAAQASLTVSSTIIFQPRNIAARLLRMLGWRFMKRNRGSVSPALAGCCTANVRDRG
jgi:hypothetical protein